MKNPTRCQVRYINPEIECSHMSRYQATHGASPLMLCMEHIKYVANQYEIIARKDLYQVKTLVIEDNEGAKNKQRIADLEQENERLRGLLGDLRTDIARLRGENVHRKQDPNELGTIYILRVGGCYKIGWTSNIQRRMRSYHPDTSLMCSYPGTRSDEKKLHKRWGHYLSHGREWFMLAPEITRHIEQIVAQYGEPGHVDFSAKMKAA